MKKIIIILIIISAATLSISMSGCYESKKVADKSGAQLWAENCGRCHNAPPPGEFNNDNWEIVGAHMQIRTNITETDMQKIINFMKSANN